MPANSKPKFKVGDIITKVFTIYPYVQDKGIVVDMDSEPDWKATYWFREAEILEDAGILYQPCEGMKDKNICTNCEFIDLCRVLPDIVRCDISEFSEWRSGNKRSLELCEQRKCPHRYVCGVKRFIRDNSDE